MGAIQTVRKTLNGLDQLSQIIADPNSGGAVRAAIGNAGQRYCDWYGSVQDGVAALGGPARATTDLVCGPYFAAAGFDGPQQVAPFEGGQCPGVIYEVWAEEFNPISGNFNPLAKQGGALESISGPVLGLRLQVGADCFTGFTNGRQLTIRGQGFNDPAERTVVPTRCVANTTGGGVGLRNLTLVRQDGQPDNCGDPEPQLQPGTNPPPAPPAFPSGETPGENPQGQPFFFVPDIQLPGADPVPLDDEPLGDAPATPGPPAGGDGLPGDPTAIADEAGEVSGGADGEEVDFGEPPEGKIWVGCVVETVTDTRIGNIPGTGPESTVWPSVRGNVALKYGTFLGRSERINSRFFDIFRPNTALMVTGCFLQAQEGSTCKVFPISGIKCPVNPCET